MHPAALLVLSTAAIGFFVADGLPFLSGHEDSFIVLESNGSQGRSGAR